MKKNAKVNNINLIFIMDNMMKRTVTGPSYKMSTLHKISSVRKYALNL